MKSFIEKILYGQAQCELIPEPEGYWPLEDKIFENFKKLTASLNEKQKQIFEEYNDVVNEQQIELLAQYYKEGFKLGLMLAAESAIK